MSDTEVRPARSLTDVRTIVGPQRADANVCWCSSYRIPSELRREVAPGVLAYQGDEVVGWAAVAPRADTTFATSRKIPHVDDLDVWSAWCVRVRPGHRGEGMSHALLAGVVDFARDDGASAVEGYPVDNWAARST